MDRKPRLKVREDLRAQALEAERRREETLALEHEHAAEDMDALYDYSSAEHRAHAAAMAGLVSFRNVTFAYPLREKKTVLHGIDLEIRPGERTAIVGGALHAVWSCAGYVHTVAGSSVVPSPMLIVPTPEHERLQGAARASPR